MGYVRRGLFMSGEQDKETFITLYPGEVWVPLNNDERPWEIKLVCECGVDAVGQGKHSDYCPKAVYNE